MRLDGPPSLLLGVLRSMSLNNGRIKMAMTVALTARAAQMAKKYRTQQSGSEPSLSILPMPIA